MMSLMARLGKITRLRLVSQIRQARSLPKRSSKRRRSSSKCTLRCSPNGGAHCASRPSPRDLEFQDRVAIAEINRPLMLAEALHFNADVVEVAEISLMEGKSVVSVETILRQQLP